MRGYYGTSNRRATRSLIGAIDPLTRYESDRATAFSMAQSAPGNFIGIQLLQPVDERGVVVDEPSSYKVTVLQSRAALETWFASVTYETSPPGYSCDVMGIDKTQLMTSTRPDGTSFFVEALGKTHNVPKRKYAPTPWWGYALAGAGALLVGAQVVTVVQMAAAGSARSRRR